MWRSFAGWFAVAAVPFIRSITQQRRQGREREQVRPLVNLIVKLQSAIDPRFAFGDKAVLLRVRPEPVSVRLADRRLWHEGLVMDSGQLVIRSAGSVGGDGTLAMDVEMAFRGDIAGATPVVGQLLRTPLVIPLEGTVQRPQFDAGSRRSSAIPSRRNPRRRRASRRSSFQSPAGNGHGGAAPPQAPKRSPRPAIERGAGGADVSVHEG